MVLAYIAIGLILYTAVALFMARGLSDKWHPDGRRKNS